MTAHLSTEEKAAAIFELLAENGPMTRADLQEVAGLTEAQFRDGWYHLRRQLGALAVVDNHRERTTYRLSNEPSTEAERYRFWQARNIYSRLWSLRATIAQMLEIARRTDAADGESLNVADRGVGDAIAAMKGEYRRSGSRAGVSDEEVERLLEAVANRA